MEAAVEEGVWAWLLHVYLESAPLHSRHTRQMNWNQGVKCAQAHYELPC